jgi:hypothetical protein
VEGARSPGAPIVAASRSGAAGPRSASALETLPLAHEWILLLDTDEIVTPELGSEIRQMIQNPARDGYAVALQQYFVGSRLKHSGASLRKLALFGRGKGRYEWRLSDQGAAMADMEVFTSMWWSMRLRNPVIH